MCGIAGFFNYSRNWKTNIDSMLERMRDRGPDSKGVWTKNDGNVVLGHTRLAIMDLSETGCQPMESSNRRYCVVLNGEIYNHKELKADIECSRLRGTSDTEVLVEYISKFGVEKTLSAINGMFAFGVYDNRDNVVYLARDRAGEKPLYYTIQNGALFFASHISALILNDGVDFKIERKVLEFYFTHKYIPSPWTIYEDIFMLEPGTYLKYDIGKKKIYTEKYWDLSDFLLEEKEKTTAEKVISYGDAVDQLDLLINNAIKKQMVADVPVGVFLSGGIDSTLIASIMQKQSTEKIKTFTVGFQKDDFDEAVYARDTAHYLGTEHHEIYLTEDELMKVVQLLPGIYGEPFGDTSAISTYFVCKFAREYVKVVLSGDAGDELFCGYNSYKTISNYWRISQKTPEYIKEILNRLPENSPKCKVGYKGRVLLQAKSISSLYESLSYRNPLVNQFCRGNYHIRNEALQKISAVKTENVEDLMMIDFLCFLRGDILTKVDRAAMSCSLETRVPLLDRDIINFAFSIPLTYKWDGVRQKKIVKELLSRYIPDYIFDRKKHGFEVPVQNWLRNGRLKEWSHELIKYGHLNCESYLNWKYIDIIWREFEKKGLWDESIWYVLMFLQWYQCEYTKRNR